MKRPQLSELTLREKIGQTVCVRENLMARIPDLVEHLKKYPYGCMWAMGNQLNDNENMSEGTDKSGKATGKAYRETAKQLMAATRVPILMAGNTESGFSSVFPELSHNMGQMAVAATDDEELIYEQAAAIAREMRASGVQWKWSPNVDTDKMCSTGIGGRSYSDDIERLIRYSVACVRGTQSEGVAVTVKHFPGKDNIEYRDSHVAPAVNRQSRAWWDKTNGYIYRELFKRAEPWGIMPGHQGLPCVDDRRMSDGNFIPTTLSHKIITGLLKGELGYKGVVITDAIGMAALATLMPENDLYVELLLAGNDMILGPTEQATDNYIDVVEQAVLDGRIPESRIDDACRRVLNMKAVQRIGQSGIIGKNAFLGSTFRQSRCIHGRKAVVQSCTLSLTPCGIVVDIVDEFCIQQTVVQGQNLAGVKIPYHTVEFSGIDDVAVFVEGRECVDSFRVRGVFFFPVPVFGLGEVPEPAAQSAPVVVGHVPQHGHILIQRLPYGFRIEVQGQGLRVGFGGEDDNIPFSDPGLGGVDHVFGTQRSVQTIVHHRSSHGFFQCGTVQTKGHGGTAHHNHLGFFHRGQPVKLYGHFSKESIAVLRRKPEGHPRHHTDGQKQHQHGKENNQYRFFHMVFSSLRTGSK